MLQRHADKADKLATAAEASCASLHARNDELCALLLQRSRELSDALTAVERAAAHAKVNDKRVAMLQARADELKEANRRLQEQSSQVCVHPLL